MKSNTGQTIRRLKAENKQLRISLERAKKYARHQHFLGSQGSKLVEFEDWAQD